MKQEVIQISIDGLESKEALLANIPLYIKTMSTSSLEIAINDTPAAACATEVLLIVRVRLMIQFNFYGCSS